MSSPNRLPPTGLEDDELEAALHAAIARHHRSRGRVRTTRYEQAVLEEWQRRQGVRALEAAKSARSLGHADALIAAWQFRQAERASKTLRGHQEQRRLAGKRRAETRRELSAELLQRIERAKAANNGSTYYLSDRALVHRDLVQHGQPADDRAVEAALRRLRRARANLKNRGH